MNSKKIKKAIERDVEKIKTLDVELLDSTIFYGETIKCAFKSAILFLFCFVAPMCNDFFYGTTELRENLLTNIFFVGLLIAVLHFMALSKFSEYVLLKKTILPQLETGNYIQKAIHSILMKMIIFLVTISTMVSVFFGFSNKSLTVFNFIGFFAFFYLVPTFIVSSVIFNLECKRYGLVAFFALLRSFFRREDPNSPSGVQRSSSTDDPFGINDPSSINHPSHPNNMLNWHHNSNNDSNRHNW